MVAVRLNRKSKVATPKYLDGLVAGERFRRQIENMSFGFGTSLTREALEDNLYRGLSELFAQMISAWNGLAQPKAGWPRVDPETAAAARERSRGLLRSLLTPQQWAEFEAAGVVSEQINGCDFRLRPGGVIEAAKARLVGTVREQWCIAPDPWADGNDYMPDEDKLIGQLLHLRADPDKLRAAANVIELL